MVGPFTKTVKRSHGRTKSEILFLGDRPGRSFVAPGYCEGTSFGFTTDSRGAIYFLSSILLILLSTFPLFELITRQRGQTIASILTSPVMVLGAVGALAIILVLYAKLGAYDDVVFDSSNNSIRIRAHRFFRTNETLVPISSAKVVETRLFGTIVNAFARNTRSKGSHACEVLVLDQSNGALYYLLWVSDTGAPRHVEWLNELRSHVRLIPSNEAGFENARMDHSKYRSV